MTTRTGIDFATEIDFVPCCENCGAAHSTQSCPEIHAALVAASDDPATLDIDELLRRYADAHEEIADLRAQLAACHDAIGAARARKTR